MSQKSDEWPKEWKEILPDFDDTDFFRRVDESWINFGGNLREYDGILYIREDDGDGWSPLSEYIKTEVAEEIEKHVEYDERPE